MGNEEVSKWKFRPNGRHFFNNAFPVVAIVVAGYVWIAVDHWFGWGDHQKSRRGRGFVFWWTYGVPLAVLWEMRRLRDFAVEVKNSGVQWMTIGRKRGTISRASIRDLWIDDRGKYPTVAIWTTAGAEIQIPVRFDGDASLMTSELRAFFGLRPEAF